MTQSQKRQFQAFVPEDDGSAMDWLENIIEQAVQAEQERIVGEIEKYGKSMTELHQEMVAKAHEDSKMMLAFDMHSRLIAVKHIKEAINLINNK